MTLVPSLIVGKRVVVSKRRELPLAGEIFVQVGQEVSANETIARTQIQGDIVIVRVCEQLGIDGQELERLIKVEEGTRVERGSLIAELKGFLGCLSSQVSAPISGTVEFISSIQGHIGIRADPVNIELLAYIKGKVVSIEDLTAVTIESSASYIQGVFGIGPERVGEILIVDESGQALLSDKFVPEKCRGSILVGGASVTTSFLHLAEARGAVGVVTGSITDTVLTEYLGYELGLAITGDEDIAMSLMITEGFGMLNMSHRAMSVVRGTEGCSASMSGATQVRAGAIRPELIVYGDKVDSGAESPDLSGKRESKLKVGATVRIIRDPYFGAYGTVTELPTSLVTVPSGVHTRVARVGLTSSDIEVLVPCTNLELYS